MAIRVRCKCGKALKVSSKHADKTIKCPGCAKPFRVSRARFEQAAAKAKAKAAATNQGEAGVQSVAANPAPAAQLELSEPAPLDDLLLADAHSQSDVLDIKPTIELQVGAQPAVIVEDEHGVEVGYARDPNKKNSRAVKYDSVAAPKRSFWNDAALAFVYPVMNADNAINFVILSIIVCANLALAFIGASCLGMLGSFIIFGWQASIYLGVVGETGRGSDDMPANNFEGGMYDGVIRPALFFIGAFALVLAPAIILWILAATGLLPNTILRLSPIWVGAGIFLFPISLMLFAFEAPGVLLRPDLICTTIAKTILPYLAIWGLLMIVTALKVGIVAGNVVVAQVPSLAGLGVLADLAATTIGGVIFTFLDVFFGLVAMRLVGLYYLHFKRRFTFQME